MIHAANKLLTIASYLLLEDQYSNWTGPIGTQGFGKGLVMQVKV